MVVELTNGRKALISVRYGKEVVSHGDIPVRDALDKVLTHLGLKKVLDIDLPSSRTTTVTITLLDQEGNELGTWTGKASCPPWEQFQKFQGRRWAMQRAFDEDTRLALESDDRALLIYEDRKRIAKALLPKLPARSFERTIRIKKKENSK